MRDRGIIFKEAREKQFRLFIHTYTKNLLHVDSEMQKLKDEYKILFVRY